MFTVAFPELFLVIFTHYKHGNGEIMARKSGIGLAIVAFALYIVGGIGTFGGLAMIGFMRGDDFLGWGDGRSIGYVFLCLGLSLSVIGVLLMRIFRNRGRV